VKGTETVSEWKEEDRSEDRSIEEIPTYAQKLKKISDHFPVIAEIGF